MRRLRSLQPVSVPLARADKVGAGYEFKLKLPNPGLAGSKPLRVHLEASARPPRLSDQPRSPCSCTIVDGCLAVLRPISEEIGAILSLSAVVLCRALQQ
jgi:hypothetical protein